MATNNHDTKERIIEAALHLVAENGMSGLSAMKVAMAAGISKSNVFHHFSTVDEIKLALFDRIGHILMAPNKFKEPKDLESFIYGLGMTGLDKDTTERTAMIVLFQYYNLALVNEHYNQLLLEMAAESQDALTGIIVSLEKVDEKKARDVSKNILMSLDALGLYLLLEDDVDNFKNIWKRQTDMFCAYLRQ